MTEIRVPASVLFFSSKRFFSFFWPDILLTKTIVSDSCLAQAQSTRLVCTVYASYARKLTDTNCRIRAISSSVKRTFSANDVKEDLPRRFLLHVLLLDSEPVRYPREPALEQVYLAVGFL